MPYEQRVRCFFYLKNSELGSRRREVITLTVETRKRGQSNEVAWSMLYKEAGFESRSPKCIKQNSRTK